MEAAERMSEAATRCGTRSKVKSDSSSSELVDSELESLRRSLEYHRRRLESEREEDPAKVASEMASTSSSSSFPSVGLVAEPSQAEAERLMDEFLATFISDGRHNALDP